MRKCCVKLDTNVPLWDCWRALTPAQVKLLIEYGMDLGRQYATDESVLEKLIGTTPTVEMFRLLFETQLAKNNTMTPFEYAKMNRLEYEFFYDTPLFLRLLTSLDDTDLGPVRAPSYLTRWFWY